MFKEPYGNLLVLIIGLVIVVIAVGLFFKDWQKQIPMRKQVSRYEADRKSIPQELAGHFPKDYPNHAIESGNSSIFQTAEEGLQWQVYFTFPSDTIKELRAKFLAQSQYTIKSSDQNLLINRRFLTEPIKTIEELQMPNDTDLLPVPSFNIGYFEGFEIPNNHLLPLDFDIIVLEAKPIRFLETNWTEGYNWGVAANTTWKQGYAYGVAISEKRNYIIYWVDAW